MRKAFLVLLVVATLPVFAQAPRIEADAGVADLLSAAKRDLDRAKPGIRLEGVHANSTSAVLAKLCGGELAVAGAARPAGAAERAACAGNNVLLIELPVGTDALAVVVNSANTWAKQLSLADLKRAWLDAPGKAASWRQINKDWPETPLKLYGPAPKLGLAVHARAVLNAGGHEKTAPELRTDVNATEILSVVVDGVARDRAALGLLDQATYRANMKRVRLVPVEGLPAFPLYVYTSAKALGVAGTRAYLDHLLANGARFAAQAGLAPLAPAAYEQARQQLANSK